MYVFHNTWYLRSTYVKKGRIPRLSHFNNAIVYARSADHPPGLVDDDKPMFGADFLADWKPGDATQPPDATFDHDYCHHPQYSLMARLSGGSPAGGDPDPRFRDRESYAFAPLKESPLIGKGKARTIRLPDGGTWTVPGGLHLGAVKRFDKDENRDDPLSLRDLGWPANGGDPGPSWATPRAGSLVFPLEPKPVPVP